MTAPPVTYRDALLQVRRRVGQIDAVTGRRIHIAIAHFADELALTARRAGPGTLSAHHASARILRTAAQALEQALVGAGEEGRALSFIEVTRIWEQSLTAAADLPGSPALLGGIRVPPLAMLGQFEALHAGTTWQTLTRQYVGNAAGEAEAVIREGILRGVDPLEVGRRLRRYVVGSEPFARLFQEVPTPDGVFEKIDLGTIPRELRGAARTMEYNARRIAFTEIHNARAEAEIALFRNDPLVVAVQWTLAPDRGTARIPDECDVLAQGDFYGLGAGVYPVDKVPAPPHPFDRSIAAWTPVLTARGWLPVAEVMVGDRVLSHRGRWRSVTESIEGRRTGGWLELYTADGRRLTITNDHPVLVADGTWRLAGALQVGDRLVVSRDLPCDIARPNGHRRSVLSPDCLSVEHQQRPPSPLAGLPLRNILGALPWGPMPATMQFDGQPAARNGHVDVVASEGVEPNGIESGLLEGIDDDALANTEPLPSEDRLGTTLAGSLGLRRASKCLSRALSALGPLGRAHAASEQDIGLDDPASRNSPFQESGPDRSTIDPASAADLGLAQPLLDVPVLYFCTVELTNVTAFSTHMRRYCLVVANDKSFIGGGIVIHNCERLPVRRPFGEAGQPKPSPARLRTAAEVLPSGAGAMRPQTLARIQARAEDAVRFGEYTGIKATFVPAVRRPVTPAAAKARVTRALRAFERRIVGQNFETGLAVDERGVTLLEKVGEAREIAFTEPQTSLVAGATAFTHNHPSGSAFSVQDLVFSRLLRVQQVRAIGRQEGRSVLYTADIGRHANRIEVPEVLRAWNRAVQRADRELQLGPRVVRGDLDELEANRVFSHRVNQLVAQQLGYRYRREVVR